MAGRQSVGKAGNSKPKGSYQKNVKLLGQATSEITTGKWAVSTSPVVLCRTPTAEDDRRKPRYDCVISLSIKIRPVINLSFALLQRDRQKVNAQENDVSLQVGVGSVREPGKKQLPY
ncbi:hypothetical protein RUM43_007622 [Polyplax serrata]|uniref:Uncharacterized protein n=1 Tax=Polyplax serrata TaxID=468196 RepID=A0AAN8P8V4_POLSC